jgi:hypothetical protein
MDTKQGKYDYGLDYKGVVEDPMDGVIASALRATGEEWKRRHGTETPAERITVSDAGAGFRCFMPSSNPNVMALSLDLEDDEAEAFTATATDRGDVDVVRCKHCEHCPCVLDQMDPDMDPTRNLYDHLMCRGDDMKDDDVTNKEIRYELYHISSRFINGILGKGNRKELPLCVVGEIKDSYPASCGNYTGFRKGFLK